MFKESERKSWQRSPVCREGAEHPTQNRVKPGGENLVGTWQSLGASEDKNKLASPAQVSVLPWNVMGAHSNNWSLKIPLVLQSFYAAFWEQAVKWSCSIFLPPCYCFLPCFLCEWNYSQGNRIYSLSWRSSQRSVYKNLYLSNRFFVIKTNFFRLKPLKIFLHMKHLTINPAFLFYSLSHV